MIYIVTYVGQVLDSDIYVGQVLMIYYESMVCQYLDCENMLCKDLMGGGVSKI